MRAFGHTAESASRSCRDHANLANHALRLAALDEAYRSNALPAGLDEVTESDVDSLVRMLSLAPLGDFTALGRMLLNPTFGPASRHVGGADADLICGDTLIDVKVVNETAAQPHYFDQLLGYFILARHARRNNPTFPLIRRLALYFARHAYLWTWDVTSLDDDREFLTLEEWFWQQIGPNRPKDGTRTLCPVPGTGQELIPLLRGRRELAFPTDAMQPL